MASKCIINDRIWSEVRMRIDLVALILILGAPAAAQAAPATPAGLCLRQDMVQGWNVLNDSTLIVTDRVGKKFRLSLTGSVTICNS